MKIYRLKKLVFAGLLTFGLANPDTTELTTAVKIQDSNSIQNTTSKSENINDSDIKKIETRKVVMNFLPTTPKYVFATKVAIGAIGFITLLVIGLETHHAIETSTSKEKLSKWFYDEEDIKLYLYRDKSETSNRGHTDEEERKIEFSIRKSDIVFLCNAIKDTEEIQNNETLKKISTNPREILSESISNEDYFNTLGEVIGIKKNESYKKVEKLVKSTDPRATKLRKIIREYIQK